MTQQDKRITAEDPAKKLVKIGARVERQERFVAFQPAEVAVPRSLSPYTSRRINKLRSMLLPHPAWA